MTLDSIPWPLWGLLGLSLLAQGTWLFLDARRRGAWAWAWGLWGLISLPLPSLLYWFFVVRQRGRSGVASHSHLDDGA